MSNSTFNILSRRSFLSRSFHAGMGAALASVVGVPPFVQRALADGTIGRNGKKVLFLFLRGANDGLNSVAPVGDPAYFDIGTVLKPSPTRPQIGLTLDPGFRYDQTGPCADLTQILDGSGATRGTDTPVFSFTDAIPLGNGFAALHPALKFLGPVYNAGDLGVIHRVAYPRQSRSHFDSQNYWENGVPNNNLIRDGIFYRAMIESGLAHTAPLTGVSVQRSLPLILRGSAAAMTNLTDTGRYSLTGVPSGTGDAKSEAYLRSMNAGSAVAKRNRDLLHLQYENLSNTMSIFADLPFTEEQNTFRDDVVTDGDTAWYAANGNQGYYLFPTTNEKNGGWSRPDGTKSAAKYVVPSGGGSTEFFNNLKAAALILNKTDAVVAGTQLDGFDTHSNQGGATGSHANLNRRIGWALYALRKYFSRYADKAKWEDVVIVTLSEFGRTTIENSDGGTDHAESSVMFVAGGGLKGYGAGNSSGVFGCHPNDRVPWIVGPPDQGGGVNGSMFGAQKRYLKRAIDFRSVLGEVIRKHLGSTDAQLARILPGYGDPREALRSGGVSAVDNTPIMGELGLL